MCLLLIWLPPWSLGMIISCYCPLLVKSHYDKLEQRSILLFIVCLLNTQYTLFQNHIYIRLVCLSRTLKLSAPYSRASGSCWKTNKALYNYNEHTHSTTTICIPVQMPTLLFILRLVHVTIVDQGSNMVGPGGRGNSTSYYKNWIPTMIFSEHCIIIQVVNSLFVFYYYSLFTSWATLLLCERSVR